MHTRVGRSFIIVISVACAVGVLLSMRSLADGLRNAYARGSDERLAIVTSAASGEENLSGLSREAVQTILNAPGIARSDDGSLLASAEMTQFIRPLDTSSGYGFRLRGIGGSGAALRPQFRVIEGRMFRAGKRELIAGVGLQRVASVNVGDSVILWDGAWTVVGIFRAGGSIAEGEIFGDAETVMTAMRRNGFNSVLVRLDRSRSGAAFGDWLTANPALTVKADNQAAYYLRTHTGTTTRFFNSIACIVSAVLAVGALFGTVKLLYSGVRMRTREIATMRAVGYDAFPVAASVVLESVLLSLAGALLGACVAWLLFDGKQTSYYQDVFQLAVSPRSVLLGAGCALVLALLGGALPAVRAARLPVSAALRAG